jgi:hypothetical protein
VSGPDEGPVRQSPSPSHSGLIGRRMQDTSGQTGSSAGPLNRHTRSPVSSSYSRHAA